MANEAQWGSLPFEEAIRFFRGKVNMPSEHGDDFLKDTHNTAFVVAGATKADLLNDIRLAVDQGISQGTTLQDFRKKFDTAVAKAGWDYKGPRDWRTRVIFETNVRTAYMSGRYQQMTHPDTVKLRPYWEYRHGDSVRPRVQHLAWNGLVLPWDDPWWQTHFTPNGYGCKCRIVSRSKRDLERMGKIGPDKAPDVTYYDWTDRSGNIHQIPTGIDPGWDYAPGASLADRAKEIVRKKAEHLPKELATRLKDSTTPTPNPKTPEEAEKLGQAILSNLLDRPSRTVPGKTIGEAFKQVILPNKETFALAKEFQENLLKDLAATRPIHTPAAVVQKTGKARNAIMRASTRFPDDWTRISDAAGPLNVRFTTKRGWAWTSQKDGWTWLNGRSVKTVKGEGIIVTSAGSTAEHEFTHRLQAVIPELDAFFQQIHRQRTQGEPLERLMDIHPRLRYKRDEVTRKDKYVEPYQGKEYDGQAREVMTMAFQALLGSLDSKKEAQFLFETLTKDAAMAHLAIGLLFHWSP
ncbi:MAG: hypothetical protein HQL89_17075 [Magnetococcales bacterium]|nr:hypothetical protein [Magnetococcales bacterium]